MGTSRIVGSGCVALAAMYTVSLVFWWPRAAELATIAASSAGSSLLRLLALSLAAHALLAVPTAVVGLRWLAGPSRRDAAVWIIAAGLFASAAPLVSYLTVAVPLRAAEGAWLRFGAHNDFGVGLLVATLLVQATLLTLMLRRRTDVTIAVSAR